MIRLIQKYVPLAHKTWFKTGGTARLYSEPSSVEEFQQVITYANRHSLPIFVLGEGANVLISDEGFDGLVIKPSLTDIQHEVEGKHSYVTAGAGVSFKALINYCLNHNLLGLEEFSGIPGTVGGAVFINIHYFEFLLSSYLTQATVLEHTTSQIVNVDNTWFNFAYNYSTLHQGKQYLAQATFKLKKGSLFDGAYARGRSDEIIRQRARRYPSERTCGSFFRNFYEHELTLSKYAPKVTHVAYYFDALGLKGQLSKGHAYVSHKHANMLVTSPQASSQDIIELARAMQELVYKHYGIIPQPECRLVGFKEHPLL